MDADQVHKVLRNPKQKVALQHQAIDLEQIGLAQFYCLECAQYFAEATSLAGHKRGSKHKKRLKVLKEVPYSHEEADMAVGVGRVKHAETKGDVVMA